MKEDSSPNRECDWEGCQTHLSCYGFLSFSCSPLLQLPAFQDYCTFYVSNSLSSLSLGVVESTGSKKILAPTLLLFCICMCLFWAAPCHLGRSLRCLIGINLITPCLILDYYDASALIKAARTCSSHPLRIAGNTPAILWGLLSTLGVSFHNEVGTVLC